MAWVFIPKGSTKYKDAAGEKIWFEKPYFDDAFRRRFNTVEEKAEFMKKVNAASVGDSDEKAKRERKEQIIKQFDTIKEKRSEWNKVKGE